MNRKRNFLIGATFVAALRRRWRSARACSQKARGAGQGAAMVEVPRFEVDPTFPKPLPNHWYQGQTIGVVGRRAGSHLDHPPRRLAVAERTGARRQDRRCAARRRRRFSSSISRATCCVTGAASSGSRTTTTSGPSSNHGITVDHKGNVWIGGNGGDDGMVLKFTKDGKFLLRVGANYPGGRQQLDGSLLEGREAVRRSRSRRAVHR